MRVAIQGQEGSYHHQAAKQFFGDDFEIVACQTFKDVFLCVAESKADKAVIAIENSLFGSINPVYDLLLKNKFWISGEVYLRIEHCLIGLTGSKIKDLKEVHTQAEAMVQCENYLDEHLPNAIRMDHHDTAASVADVKNWADPKKAAIASAQAAKLHGVEILEQGIEDNKQNYTRFVVLQKDPLHTAKNNKTSLVLTTKSDTKAGALHEALGVFAGSNINLSMLQSRPLVGKAWHYHFYIDLDIGEHQPLAKEAFKQLESHGFDVAILGSYQNGR